MADTQTNEYLKTQIMTASREQLMLMLYDGCIRFCEQAKGKIDEKDIEGSYQLLVKAKNIIFEFMRTLKYDVDHEFCTRLGSLYNYIYRLLIEANVSKDKEKIDEVISLLRPLRETWGEAVKNLRQEKAEEENSPDSPAPKTPQASASPYGGQSKPSTGGEINIAG